MNGQREYIFNLQGVDIFLIRNFIGIEECAYLCNLIRNNQQPSSVTGMGDERRVYNETRTSQSAFLDPKDTVVQAIDHKIAAELNIPSSYGEPLQGQLYHVGEYFNDHTDFFDSETLVRDCPVSGQRTWTAMIYLNNVLAGGHTEFPVMGKSFAPILGTALFWKNSDGQGFENPATLHSGCSVVEGEKLIITKWFREHEYQPIQDQKQSVAPLNDGLTAIKTLDGDTTYVKIENIQGIPHARYKTNQDIPAVTKTGFKKTQIPADLYQQILEFYHQGRSSSTPEFDPSDPTSHLNSYIKSEETHFPTEMIPITQDLKNQVFQKVKGVLESWSGRKLASTHCYGIRTYKRGSVLKKHTDGFETRIVSAILNVDQQVDQPWALQIDDHQGVEHEVFMEPGEMVLYESAILDHGRVKPLEGDYYSNLFVHFINVT